MSISRNESASVFQSECFCSAPLPLRIDARRIDEGLIEAHAVRFGGPKISGSAIIRPGAFSSSLAFHRAAGTFPAMTWNHDPADIVGRWTEIREESHGLKVVGRIAINTERGQTLRRKLLGGIDGLAASFRLEKSSGGDVTSAHVFEVSFVSSADVPREPEAQAPHFGNAVDLEKWLRVNGMAKGAAKKLAAAGWNALQTRTEDNETAARRLASLLNESTHELAFRR